MIQTQNSKTYDLGDRTLEFAECIRNFVNLLPFSITNNEYGKQLVRASGSVGANYIEAEEALSKKDFFHRIKISRKESKESRFWLYLCEPKQNQMKEKEILIREATELMKIFGSIVKQQPEV